MSNYFISENNEEMAFDFNECNIFIDSTTVENNYLNNFKLFNSYGKNEFIFMISNTKIKNNYGNSIFFNIMGIFSLMEIIGCEISGNNISNIFLIQNSYEGNLSFMNVNFENNTAKKIIILKNIEKIMINSMVFSNNNWLYKNLYDKLIGPCMLLVEVGIIRIENIKIAENLGKSNMVGIAIIQSEALLISYSSIIFSNKIFFILI